MANNLNTERTFRFLSKSTILVLTSALCALSAQIFLKLGLQEISSALMEYKGPLSVGGQFLLGVTLWQIWVGVAAYSISILSWLFVLGDEDLSIAAPLLSISYLFSIPASVLILNEPIHWLTIVGVLIICVGISYLLLERKPLVPSDSNIYSDPVK